MNEENGYNNYGNNRPRNAIIGNNFNENEEREAINNTTHISNNLRKMATKSIVQSKKNNSHRGYLPMFKSLFFKGKKNRANGLLKTRTNRR